MTRRTFTVRSFASLAASMLCAAGAKRPPRILLRSSWQVVNIGDIAHTPGVLALIEKHIPEAEVVLWASGDFSPQVSAMEYRRFPKLRIVKGSINANGKASNAELDAAALSFLKSNGLEEKKFLCCIPRLRNTPYWKIRNTPMDAEAHRRHARNEAMKEHDHAPLREAICAVVRETGLKVLVCPEDMSQMAVGKEMLVDKLPDDVRKNVVWHEQFWLTDEALSTYMRSAGIFGLEMHSPIMCIGNGIPAIVCRFAEQTSKGFMWRDIGLGDWLFDFDTEADLPRLTPAILELIRDPLATREKLTKAQTFVATCQCETMAALAEHLPLRSV